MLIGDVQISKDFQDLYLYLEIFKKFLSASGFFQRVK